MSSRSLHFFATKSDLLSAIATAEQSCAVSYVECGLFDLPDRPRFASLAAAQSGTPSQSGGWFLVLTQNAACSVRPVPQRRRNIKYAIDQKANPGTVAIQPGTNVGELDLVAGQIGTVHADESALMLLELFQAAIKRSFTQIKSFWVGPEANVRLANGARLMPNVNSPNAYDLTLL